MSAQQTPKRIGQAMWFAAWVLLLAMLYLFFADQVEEKYNPNRDLVATSAQEVTLKRNRAGHYLAPGQINGQPVNFLLDTGATTISIPQSVADRLQLQPGIRQQVNTANGSINVYAAKLDSVSLGGITLRQIQGHINPHMDGDTVLLGMSFMKNLEIRQKGDYLTLKY
ncbi:retropepsin-like aspartic protease family protein [Neptuniibacter halophilus]|uniref:retropepsin-like aspartic protease family protein n=1 Tax=Neptuniibacter halophilus TaxID=651666 RepID=UPI0025747D8D|nr:retropepsin-like aspartic protease [Neptuniibacter halophilus]